MIGTKELEEVLIVFDLVAIGSSRLVLRHGLFSVEKRFKAGAERIVRIARFKAEELTKCITPLSELGGGHIAEVAEMSDVGFPFALFATADSRDGTGRGRLGPRCTAPHPAWRRRMLLSVVDLPAWARPRNPT